MQWVRWECGPEGVVRWFLRDVRAKLKDPVEHQADTLFNGIYKNWCMENRIPTAIQVNKTKFGVVVKKDGGVSWQHTRNGNVYTISPNP